MLGKFFKKLFATPAKTRPAILPPEPEVVIPSANFQPANVAATAEELCGLREGMTTDELRQLLAKLYRRHNRAASSLNAELRAEAERMLDAIVEVRQRYLGDGGSPKAA